MCQISSYMHVFHDALFSWFHLYEDISIDFALSNIFIIYCQLFELYHVK